MGFWEYWRGRYRLSSGWCPRCESSPPKPGCDICDGSYNYGPVLHDTRRALWRDRWEAARRH